MDRLGALVGILLTWPLLLIAAAAVLAPGLSSTEGEQDSEAAGDLPASAPPSAEDPR